MRRRALRVLTLSSFIFALLIGAVWLRSYVQFDLIQRRSSNEAYAREYLLGWSLGRVNVSFAHRQQDPEYIPAAVSEALPQWGWSVDDPVILRSGRSVLNGYGFSLMGNTVHFATMGEEHGSTLTRYGFVLPCWAIFSASMLLPAVAWRRRRKPTIAAAEVIGASE